MKWKEKLDTGRELLMVEGDWWAFDWDKRGKILVMLISNVTNEEMTSENVWEWRQPTVLSEKKGTQEANIIHRNFVVFDA